MWFINIVSWCFVIKLPKLIYCQESHCSNVPSVYRSTPSLTCVDRDHAAASNMAPSLSHPHSRGYHDNSISYLDPRPNYRPQHGQQYGGEGYHGEQDYHNDEQEDDRYYRPAHASHHQHQQPRQSQYQYSPSHYRYTQHHVPNSSISGPRGILL